MKTDATGAEKCAVDAGFLLTLYPGCSGPHSVDRSTLDALPRVLGLEA